MAVTAKTTKAKDVTKMTQRQLAEELLEIERDHEPVFKRVDDLKGALRAKAGEAGGNFKEVFPGRGEIQVSAPHDGKVKGTEAIVLQDRFLALPQKERNRLTDETNGILQMAVIKSGKYYGAVTVKLF